MVNQSPLNSRKAFGGICFSIFESSRKSKFSDFGFCWGGAVKLKFAQGVGLMDFNLLTQSMAKRLGNFWGFLIYNRKNTPASSIRDF